MFTFGLLARLPPPFEEWLDRVLSHWFGQETLHRLDGGRACSQFSHSFSGIRCTERSSKLMAAPTQSSFSARTLADTSQWPLFAVENHRPSLRHRHQGAVHESL